MKKHFLVHITLLPLPVFAQKEGLYPVGGRILSSDTQLPLCGAGVEVLGTNTSVRTTKKGQFVVHLKTMPVALLFTCEGYVKQEVLVQPPQEAPQLLTATSYRAVL